MSNSDISNDLMLIEVERLAGLDAIRALDAMSGQTGLYLKLVKSFAQEHQGAVVELQGLYAKADWPTLRRRVHSLKSYTAYVGAYPLSSICAKVESALTAEDNQGVVQETIDQICGLLGPLVEQLQTVIADNQPPLQETVFSLVVFRRSLITLLPLLKQSDFAAEQLLQELIQLTKNTEYHLLVNKIHDLVDDVEYEVAVEETEKLLDSLKGGLFDNGQ